MKCRDNAGFKKLIVTLCQSSKLDNERLLYTEVFEVKEEGLSSFKSMNLFEYEKSRASQKASTDKGLKKKLILPKLVLC